MKKLLFVVAVSFFSRAVYAQIGTSADQYDEFAPKELKCTEEAISFRLTIRPGQLYSFRPGYRDFDNAPSSFNSPKSYTDEDMIIEPLQLVKYENAFNRQDIYSNKNFLFPAKTIKSIMQTGQFNNCVFYNYYNSLQSSTSIPGLVK